MYKNPIFRISSLYLFIVVFLTIGAKDISAQYEVHWNSPVFQNIRWERGETVTLTWRLAVTVSNNNYSIFLRRKSGPTYSTAIPTPSCSGPSCSMQWTIPDYLPNGSDYYMVLTASNNNASDSEESVTFTIGPSPAETQVRLRSPNTGLENISTNPTLQWYAMNGAESYQFQLSNQPSMGTPLNIDVENLTSINYIATNLEKNRIYYWRVRAKINNQYAVWSEIWNFKTAADLPNVPTLKSPSDGTGGVAIDLWLTWNSALDASKYHLQVATDNNFGSIFFESSDIGVTSYEVRSLVHGVTYYWRVRGSNTAGNGTWSENWSFSRDALYLSPPNLQSPADNNTNISTNTTFQWNSVTSADKYKIEVATDNSFAVQYLKFRQDNIAGTSYNISNLEENTTYFWRIQASNSTLTSEWSQTYQFLTLNITPTVSSVSPLTATVNEEITFTVTGNNLTSGMGFFVQNLSNITEQSGGSSTKRYFKGRFQEWSGVKSGNVKDAPGGTELFAFSVNVSEPDIPSLGTINTPIAGSSEVGSFTANGTASDGDKINIITLDLTQDNGTISKNIRVYEDNSSVSTSSNWSKSIPVPDKFHDGVINLGLWVKDKNGIATPVYNHNINWSKPIIEKYPRLLLSNGVIDEGESIAISGSDFTLSGNAKINILSTNSESEVIEIIANSEGNWQTSYSPSVAGTYFISATDLTNQKTTQTKTLIVNEVDKPLELEIVSPLAGDYADGYLSVGKTFAVTWKDIANRGSNYPISGARREFKYTIEVSYDDGLNWEDIGISSGWQDIGKQINKYYPFELTHDSKSFFVRVVDYFDDTRVVERGPFKIGSRKISDVESELVWDYSYPNRNGNPIGVAADGVGRIYVRVFKVDPNTSAEITEVSITLSDGNNTTTALLGKLMPASIINEYSEEANYTNEITASIYGNQNEYWFWYVAPDDFAHEVMLNTFRTVSANIKVTFTSGLDTEIEKEIKIKRPPLILAHGLASDPSKWNKFKLHNGAQVIYDQRFFTKAIKLSPKERFRFNAPNLLPYEEGKGIFPTTISDYRGSGFAANQVYYVGHSMGGNVLRTAIQEYPNLYKIGKDSRIEYKNYGLGYVDRAITIATPHSGSPWGNLIENFSQLINESIKMRGYFRLGFELRPEGFLWDFIEPSNQNSDLYVPTGAVADLRIGDGFQFARTEIPGHMISGDIISDLQGFWEIPDATWSSLAALNESMNLLEQMMDVIIALGPKELRDKMKEKIFTINNPVKQLVAKLNIAFKTYASVEFLVDSDIIVGVESQLSGGSIDQPNTSYIGNTNHISIIGNSEVGSIVENLLQSPISENKFDDFPASFSNTLPKSKAIYLAGKTSTKYYEGMMNLEDSTTIDLYADSLVTMKINIQDTTNLVFVKVYFQNQVLVSTERTTYYEFSTQVGSDLVDRQLVQTRAFYDYGDSTKFIIDDIEVNILTNYTPTNLSVTPLFTELQIEQTMHPTYNVEFGNTLSRLGNNNENIKVNIENSEYVKFEPSNGSFSGIAEGETSVEISYKGVIDTVYIAVRKSSSTTDVKEDEKDKNINKQTPSEYTIEQNYPNPFNPSTSINFSLPKHSRVKVVIYNLLGESVKTVVDEEKAPGYYSVKFNANGLPSGLYFYRIIAGNFIETKKMVLLK